MTMELRQLQYFAVLAEELHFKRAADRLFIVQPALSRQIQVLEQDLGVVLFDRDKRHVALTEAGKFLQQKSRQMLAAAQEIRNQIPLVAGGEQGEVRIGYVGSCIHTIFPKLLPQLHEQYPLIQAYLSEMVTSNQLAALRSGQLDIGFLRNPPLDERFEQKVVFEEPYALVLREDYPLNQSDFYSLKQVAQEPFIMPTRSDGENYYRYMMGFCEEAGFSPKVAHETVHGQTISILPVSFEGVSSGKLKFFPLPNTDRQAQLTAYWPKEAANPVLKNFLKLFYAG